MNVFAVYVVNIDGRIIVTERFMSINSMPDDLLFGGLITALQGVATEIAHQKTKIRSIIIGKLSYHIRDFGLYRIVLVTSSPDPPESMIDRLHLLFIKDYQEELFKEVLVPQNFEPFKKTMRDFISTLLTIDESRLINPWKILGTSDLYHLPKDLHATAMVLIALTEATVDEIAKEAEETFVITSKNLKILQKMGYIGMKANKDKKIYFVSN